MEMCSEKKRSTPVLPPRPDFAASPIVWLVLLKHPVFQSQKYGKPSQSAGNYKEKRRTNGFRHNRKRILSGWKNGRS